MTAASSSTIIDTRILGNGVANFGGNLESNPWRGWKFVWMNYVGAVGAELRDNTKQVEAARAATPMSNLVPAVQQQATQLAHLFTKVLKGMALVMIMNIEDGYM
jgi:hypothetical protein